MRRQGRLRRLCIAATGLALIAPAFASADGLSENFNGVTPPALPAGWTSFHNGVNQVNWTTSAAVPDGANGSNNVFVPDPTGVTNSYLVSPVVTPGAQPLLSFRQNFDTENLFDGGILEVSENGGAFQELTAAGGYFEVGGYTATINPMSSNQIAGRQAWTGMNPGNPAYMSTLVGLPFVSSADSIQLRWRMTTDAGNAGSPVGWRIDSVRLGHAPHANTDTATGVTTTEATLNGIVGSDLLYTHRFQYGTTTAYGSQTANVTVTPTADEEAVTAVLSGLEPGTTYHYRLLASNGVGQDTGADKTFTTATPTPPDTTAPETRIDGLTQNKRKTNATVAFSADDAAATFECAVDAATFAPCSSPLALKGLKKGPHTLAVRAKDAAGNVDQTPAQQRFKIKKRRRHHH